MICTVNNQIVNCPEFLENIAPLMTLFPIVILALIILTIAGLWKIFKKANKPGWTAIVPIYNIVIILKIINRPTWWVILLFIPFIDLVVMVIIMIDLAKSFGKGAGFGVGLTLLNFIFLPILGFGSAQYIGTTVRL